MPTRKIGIRLMIGPVCSTPSSSAPCPCWKTTTTAPREASTDSRKPAAAFSGTSSERKTTSSSTTARPTTTIRYGTSAACTLAAMSMFIAVVPVTSKVAPVSASVAGRSSRMVVTRSFVFSSVGAVDGTTEKTAVSPASLKRAGETDTTPSVPAISSETVVTAPLASLSPLASTTTVSGPLKPGPNASASAS
ncbi:hypothetical protein SCHAM137S_01876 [Streptomyces chartreusis]